MSKFIVLGKFSGQGAKGLMTSDADRSAIVDKAARAAGAKMISYHITRGIYDFCVIAEGDDEGANQIFFLLTLNFILKVLHFQHKSTYFFVCVCVFL